MPDIFLYAGQATPGNIMLGDPTVQRGGGSDIVVDVTGVASAGVLGTPSVTATASVEAAGVESAGIIGTLIATATASVAAAGVVAQGQIGAVAVTATASVAVAGIASAGAIGEPEVTASVSVATAGVASAGAVGLAAVTASVLVAIAGVSASGWVGAVDVTTSGDATVNVPGVFSAAELGIVYVEIITPSSDAGGGGSTVKARPRRGAPGYSEHAIFGVYGMGATASVGRVSVEIAATPFDEAEDEAILAIFAESDDGWH
jgi:hypothetical protein